MKYLITGVSGQLGYDVKRELLKRGINENEIACPLREVLDFTDAENTKEVFAKAKPDIVFHCAAWTNVDGAEEDFDACNLVNNIGTANIVNEAKKYKSKLIYVSTDYVFDGTKDGIYEPSDEPNPQNVYGKTKLSGENIVRTYPNHFIVRTSWVFGINGKNFVRTMLRLAETKTELNVVCDQIGSPTYTVDLAKLIVDMSETEKYGTYHGTNEGFCSWADFAKYIFASNDINMKVNDIESKDYPQKAYRPKNSRLSKEKLLDNGFERLPEWENAINRYNKELRLEKK